MKVQADNEGRVASRHLPPVESSLLLALDVKNRVRAIDKIDVPLDEFGVPRPLEYLEALAQTLDPSYILPPDKNVHHLAYPRLLYTKRGSRSVQYKYRETTALMVDIPIQLHNYGHWVTNDPPMPSYEVMRLRVKEQNQIDRLFKIGQAVVSAPRWLDQMIGEGVQTYRTAQDYADIHMTEAMFYDYLDKCSDPVVGLMPDRGELASLGVCEATRKLGALSAARALCLNRESQEMVRRAA